ncbi:MAG: PAS domain S-box protein [Ignavibacteriae bacterium]|nr:PAS domain S-box protein [Ignavibacteriota bacterium]
MAASTPKYRKRYLAFISFLVILTAILAGFFYYRYEEKVIVNNQKQNLEAIAELKIEQIRKWMEENVQNADNVSKNPYSLKEIDDLINGTGEPGLKDVIINRLKYRVNSFQYENIYLTTPAGKVILAANDNDNKIDTSFLKDIRLAGEKRVAMFSDFRFCNIHNKIHLLVISPNINSKNVLLGFLVFAIDPSEYLYPLIQKWPTESETAETVLFEKNGNEVLFINELRHQPNSALKLRIPLSNVDLPAVKAINGERGIVDGTDYRGNKVLAYVTQLKGTNWYMTSKIDKDEVFVELKYRAYFISSIVVLMVLFTSTLAAYVYNSRQRFILQSLVTKDEELVKSQELLAVMGSVAKIGGWEFDVTTKMGSWTKEVAIIHEVDPAAVTNADIGISFYVNDSKEKIENALTDAIEKGIPYDLELEMVTAKGNHKWVRTIGEPFKENGRVVKLQGSLQDVTEKKAADEKLKESESRFRTLLNDVMSISIQGYDMNGITNYWNKASEKIYGYTAEEALGISLLDTIIPPEMREGVKAAIKQMHETGIAIPASELNLMKKDGSRVDVFSSHVILKTKGREPEFYCIDIDISERKKLEETQAFLIQCGNQGENFFESLAIHLAESIKTEYVCIDVLEPDGMARTLANYADGKFDENITYALKDTPCGDVVEKRICVFEKNVRKLFPNDLVLQGMAAESYVGTTLLDSKGNKIGLIAIVGRKPLENPHLAESILKLVAIRASGELERSQAEDALRISEERYKTFINSTKDIIFLKDDNLKYVVSNEANNKFLNREESAILGKDDSELMPENIAVHCKAGDKQAIEKGTSVVNVEIVDDKYYETTKFPVKLANGKTGIGGYIRDITIRRNAEEAIKSSEEKYRALFEANNDGISIFYPNPDGTASNFVDVNDAATKMLGYTKDEYRQLSIIDLGEEVSEEVFLERKKALMTNKVVNTETRIKHKNGNWVDVEITITTIIYNNRIAVMNIVRDISDRKMSLAALEKSEEKLRLAMQATKQGWFELNIQTGEILVSDSYSEILGYEPGEFNSTLNNWLVNLHPDDIGSIKLKFKKCIESGESSSMEYRRKTKSGDWIWLRSVGKVVEYDAKGNPLKMSGTHMDISDRKLAEEELRVSEENFRNLVETMPEGYYRSLPEGRFLYVNPAFATMLGYDSKEELMSVDIADALYFKIDDRNVNAPQREEFNPVSELYRLKAKDGSEIWIEDFCRYRKDENGNTILHEGVCRDITTRKKMDEELINAKEKAEELSKIKSNFLANMSHELRTPMVGILGFSEVLKNSLEDEELKHYAEVIHKGGTRLMDTLNLILNISAIESDNIKVINEDFDLLSEIKDVIEFFEPTAIQKNLSLSYKSPYDKKIINTDKKILGQILSNIVNNAVKYTSTGSILVDVEEVIKSKKLFVSIKIKDTGIGIPKDKQELIWETFRQVSEGLSRGFEGTGLGLSITKKYIDIIGGEIFLQESQPGVGTTFTVLIPVNEVSNEQSVSDIETPKSVTLKNTNDILPSVLYVDDDSMSIDLVKVLVKSICKLDSVSTGAEAVEKAKSKKYDLILMDINLGKDIDGLETTELIRTIRGYEKTPVIAVTALAMKYDREKFLAKGCTHYISKPFLKEEFIPLLSQVLAQGKV